MNQKTTIYRHAIFGLSILGYCSLFGTLSAAQLLNDGGQGMNDSTVISLGHTLFDKAFFADKVASICDEFQTELDEKCEIPTESQVKAWDKNASASFMAGTLRSIRKDKFGAFSETPDNFGVPKVAMNKLFELLRKDENIDDFKNHRIFSYAKQFPNFCRNIETKLLLEGIPSVKQIALSTTKKAFSDPSWESKATLSVADLPYLFKKLGNKVKELDIAVSKKLLRVGLKEGNEKLVINTIELNPSHEIIDFVMNQTIELHKVSKIATSIAKQFIPRASQKGKVMALINAAIYGDLDMMKEIIEKKHVTNPKIISEALNEASNMAHMMVGDYDQVVNYLAMTLNDMQKKAANSLDENKNDEPNISDSQNSSNIMLKVLDKPKETDSSSLIHYFRAVDIIFSTATKSINEISSDQFEKLFMIADTHYKRQNHDAIVVSLDMLYPQEKRKIALRKRWTAPL